MRRFIVSDLHGNGNIYNSIMAYLENINNLHKEEITLYINGDLIDRGWAAGEMLLDVKDRIENKRGFKIEYLGGNHELMMYQALKDINDNTWPTRSLWFANCGDVTAYGLEPLCVDIKELKKVNNFVGNLKLYHKFNEEINGKKIVLAHSKCPTEVLDKCNLKIKDDNEEINDIVWTRKDPKKEVIVGNPDYFTIIGHTIVRNKSGYSYNQEENFLNIDGGCAAYVMGHPFYDHIPLVEIDGKNNRLIILLFNNENEIIKGVYFNPENSTQIEDLTEYRKYLNPKVKTKKMVIGEDNYVFFE